MLTWRFHPKQAEVWEDEARIKIVAKGRRWGKSHLGARWILAGAIADAKAGIPGLSWVVAPIHDLTRTIWRACLDAMPAEGFTKVLGTEFSPGALILGPHTIEFKSADNPQRLVSVGLRRLLVDESGTIKELTWTESLQPTLLDYEAPAMLIGTPKGRNWFHKLYVQGCDRTQQAIRSFQGPSHENPRLSRSELERLQRDMSERMFRQEILAEFLSDEGAVFRGVRKCVAEGPQPWTTDGAGKKVRKPAHVVGVDLAKVTDFTVLYALSRDGACVHFDRWNEVSWPLQKARIMAAAQGPCRGATFILDSTGQIADPHVEELRRAGVNAVPAKISAASKAPMIEGLAIAVEQCQIGIPDDPVCINEFEIFEYEQAKSGAVRYAAPEGLHDDCVIAAGLAWQGRQLAVTIGGARITI